MQIEVVHSGMRTIVALETRLTVGRGGSNDLIIAEPNVSTHHAILWVEGQVPWVRDLGSRNGTLVDGETIRGVVALSDGSTLGIGDAQMTVRFSQSEALVTLQHVGSSLRHPVAGSGLTIGPEGCDIQADVAETRVRPTISGASFSREDEIWAVEFGETVTLGTTAFRVLRAPTATPETVATGGLPYELTASLAPPLAVLVDRVRGTQVEYTADNRVALLYLLARSNGEWLEEPDVLVGVWGRTALGESSQRLTALVFRIRDTARSAGFDTSFIERRKGALRLVAQHVELR